MMNAANNTTGGKPGPTAVIAGVRTPFAKAFTGLADRSAVDLGVHAVKHLMERAGQSPNQVDEVVMGNVAGQPDAANLARVISLKAGIPQDRIAHTVNRNCASGMESIVAAMDSLSRRSGNTIIAGGTESMSNIPMLFSKQASEALMRLSRSKTLVQKLGALAAFRPKHLRPMLGIELGLTDPFSGLNMGETAEILAKDFNCSRTQQDSFAVTSHTRAEAAQKACFLSGEIAPIDSLKKDNAIRYGQSMHQLEKLKPIFTKGAAITWPGTVTAGNSCGLSDGAAALLLCRADDVARFDTPPIGYITAQAIAGCDPRRMGLGPVYATSKLLRENNLQLSDFDLIEINEAFAAQVLACETAFGSATFAEQELGLSKPIGELPMDRVNVHGGAIALGHPVGTTGTRIILTLLRSLKARGLRRGLATLCVGGGQGVAMMVETEMENQR